MNLELSEVNISNLEETYGKQIEMIKDQTWQIELNCCGCSGDCGSDWMRS